MNRSFRARVRLIKVEWDIPVRCLLNGINQTRTELG